MADSDTDQVELTVQRMAELHARHVEAQTAMQRHVSRVTRWLSTPRAVPIGVERMFAWLALNRADRLFGMSRRFRETNRG